MDNDNSFSCDVERNADDLLIPYMIKCAKSGCKQSARELMELASKYLSSGVNFPNTLKAYLSTAFQEIAKGKSADKELYLSHGRGKNDAKNGLYKKQTVANEVRRLYWIGEAKTIEEACSMACKDGTRMIDEKTAYKYYYEIFPGTPERCPIV
jgi:hypothetical protein